MNIEDVLREMRAGLLPKKAWADAIEAAMRERDAKIEVLAEENCYLRGALHDHEQMVNERDAEIERLREDAERYRFLRDEDNWGCDNDETTESRWGDLGECHGGDFDVFVDEARAALALKEKEDD